MSPAKNEWCFWMSPSLFSRVTESLLIMITFPRLFFHILARHVSRGHLVSGLRSGPADNDGSFGGKADAEDLPEPPNVALIFLELKILQSLWPFFGLRFLAATLDSVRFLLPSFFLPSFLLSFQGCWQSPPWRPSPPPQRLLFSGPGGRKKSGPWGAFEDVAAIHVAKGRGAGGGGGGEGDRGRDGRAQAGLEGREARGRTRGHKRQQQQS